MVKGKLVKFEPLATEETTVLVKCPKGVNLHDIVDMLNKDIVISKEIQITPDQGKLALLGDIRHKLERIEDYIDLQDKISTKQIITNIKTVISSAMGIDYHLSENEIDFILTNELFDPKMLIQKKERSEDAS